MTFYYSLAIFIVFLGCPYIHAKSIELSVNPERGSYVVGEPVILECHFANSSDLPVEVDLGKNDIGNISFELNPGTANAVKYPYTIRRGGGVIPGKVTVAAHGTICRYVVLDQCFRSNAPGVFKLELILSDARQSIKALFNVKMEAADNGHIKSGVNAIVQKYFALKIGGERTRVDEWMSYRLALEAAFSYLANAPEEIWKDVKRQHQTDQGFLMLLESSQSMGPGGNLILD